MSNDSFSACVNRLEKIGVLMSTDAKAGCKKECSLDISGYNIALRILEATNNREALSKFCDDKFVKEPESFEQCFRRGNKRTEGNCHINKGTNRT